MLACPRCGSSYSRDQEFCGVDGERLADQPFDPLVGRTIDRYRIIGTLGDGGMARVYRARHVYLEQDVAIKVLFGDVASDRSLARRFQREAQAASRIKHPNVVTTIDFGATPEGLIFMAMELLEGRTLSDFIRGEGSVPPERAAFLVRQIAEGLSAAHALGFVHRDLKPKNVMLVGERDQECLKILDFGLVLLTEADPGIDATNLTRAGQVFGTPAYMAPEQVAGNPVGDTADLYALGVILYQLLSGNVPFTGAAAQIAMHHLSTEPPPLAAYCGLGPIAMALLAKDPRNRPQTALEVIAAIDHATGATALRGRDVTGALAGPLDAPLHSFPPLAVSAEDDPAVLSFFASDSSLRTDVTREVGPELERAALGPRRGSMLAGLAGAVAAVGLGFVLYAHFDAPSVDARPSEDPVVARASDPPLPRHMEAIEPPQAHNVAAHPSTPASAHAVAPPPPPSQAQASATQPSAPAVMAPSPPSPPSVEARTPPQDDPVKATPEVKDGNARTADRPHPEEPPIEPPPPRSEGDRARLATRKDFERQDLHLAFALSRRGLNWRDLADVVPEIAQTWGLWRIGADKPSIGDLEDRASELDAAIMRIRVDSPLLEAKLERVRRTLGDLPEERKDARHDVLVQRYNSIRSRVLRAWADEVKARLAQEITVLENDASILVNAGTPHRVADPEPGLSHDPDVDIAQTSTITLSF